MTLMTPGMRRVLTLMRDAEDEGRHEDAELVCEGIRCWIGTERTNRAVVRLLLQFTLVRDASDAGGIERYSINGPGRSALRRPEILAEISAALAAHGAFTVVDDRLVALPG